MKDNSERPLRPAIVGVAKGYKPPTIWQLIKYSKIGTFLCGIFSTCSEQVQKEAKHNGEIHK